MAITLTTDFTLLYNANTSFGGGTVYTGFQRFGTGCNGGQVSNTTSHFSGTVTSFSLVGRAIYSWMLGPTYIGTLAQGGYRIVIGDGTNTRAYYVGGSNVTVFNALGWNCFILHGDNLPTNFQQLAGANQPNLAAITVVGVGFRTVAKVTGTSPNCFWDVARVGTGLTISGGTTGDPGKFDDIIANEATNAWGVLENFGGGTYGCQGRLTFGVVTNSNPYVFIETNKTLFFSNRLVGSDFYQFNVIGQNETGNTNSIFRLGEKLTSGDDVVAINGCTISGSGINVSFLFDNRPATVHVYGTTISNINLGVVKLCLCLNILHQEKHEFIGNTLNRCGTFDPQLSIVDQCNIINSNSEVSMILGDYIPTLPIITVQFEIIEEIKNTSFIGNDVAISHKYFGEFNYNNITFNNNTIDVKEDGNLNYAYQNYYRNSYYISNPINVEDISYSELNVIEVSPDGQVIIIQSSQSFNTDYTVEYPEIIYRSLDGGVTWDKVLQIPEQETSYYYLNFVMKLSKNLGYIYVGIGSILYRSSNLGQSWDIIYTLDDEDFAFIFFVTCNNTGQYVYLGIYEGDTININRILLSSDYGNTFTPIDISSEPLLENNNIGYYYAKCSGDGSTLYMTTDIPTPRTLNFFKLTDYGDVITEIDLPLPISNTKYVITMSDELDKIFVSVRDSTPNSVRYFRSYNDGVNWTELTISETNKGPMYYQNGVLVILTEETNIKLYYSLDEGNNFTYNTLLETRRSLFGISNSSYIINSIKIDETKRIHALNSEDPWNSSTYGYWNIPFYDDVTVTALNGSNPFTTEGEVTIINPTIFRVTGLIPDSEVRIFRTSDRTEIAGVESSGTVFEYLYSYTGDIDFYLVVHKETYEYIKLPDLVLTDQDQTITVQQRFDRNYLN